jgi:predicted DNA-binding transcriptional regulator AlpA
MPESPTILETPPAPDARSAGETLLWTAEDVCRCLHVGRTRLYASLKSGTFGPVPVKAFGRRLLFRADEVRKWVAADCPPRRAWLSMTGRT